MSKKEEKNVRFEKREFYGSRFRCLKLTHMGKEKVYAILREVCKNGEIKIEFNEKTDNYFPKGFTEPVEKKLGNIIDKTFNKVLTGEIRLDLRKWWLEVRSGNANTPNWDIISTCNIDGKPGLLLVETKAHHGENSSAGKTKDSNTNLVNHEHIKNAIDEAKKQLAVITKHKIGIDRDCYYQMSNRFAWTWKLADLGIPVVLVYLGFTNAYDMEAKGNKIFKTHGDFGNSMTTGKPATIIDPKVWGKKWEVEKNGKKTPFIALLRSLECNTFIELIN